jgi:hypothetical protein
VPVKLDVGSDQKKEATKPIPDTYKQEQNTVTAFEEITYSTANSNKTIIRDAFYTVNCVCKMASGTAQTYTPAKYMLQPDGTAKWVAGLRVSKPYGVVDGNGQNRICDTCCRDHHDAAVPSTSTANSFDTVYDPFRPTTDYSSSGNFSGDHKHYSVSTAGAFTEATNNNDSYRESCRMVLVEGQLRVTQDWRLAAVNMMPNSYFGTTASPNTDNINNYSSYVKEFVKTYILNMTVNNPTAEPLPPSATGPLPSTYTNKTGLENAIATAAIPATGQINRGSTVPFSLRGIYVDYINSALYKKIRCLIDYTYDDGQGACENTANGDFLLYTPFHEVNLTQLAHWSVGTMVPVNSSVISSSVASVTDDAIPGANQVDGVLVAPTYSRGSVTVKNNTTNPVTEYINAIIGRSNTALTSAAVDRDNSDVSISFIDPQEKTDYLGSAGVDSSKPQKNDRVEITVINGTTSFP